MSSLRLASNRSLASKELLALLLVCAVGVFSSYAIVSYPFPANLVLLSVPLGAVGLLISDVRTGLAVWFVAASLGNAIELDFPGLPPLRAAHIGLLLLLALWFVKSWEELPAAVGRFTSTGANRVLVALMGWITLSMFLARFEGATQSTVEYQFSAWLSVALPVALGFVMCHSADERFSNKMIWVVIAFYTVSAALSLMEGFLQGAGLTGWKELRLTDEGRVVSWAYGTPLAYGLAFWGWRRWWGRVLAFAAIAVSTANVLVMVVSGHRTSLLFFAATLSVFLLATRGRLAATLAVLVVLPAAFLNFATIESWGIEQTAREVTDLGVSIGPGSRLTLAQDAAEIIASYPVWGTGTDLYRLHANVKIIYPDGVIRPAPTPHNSWLQVAVDSGLPALLLLVAFCVYAVRDGLRLFGSATDEFSRRISLLFLLVLGAAIAQSFIGSGKIVPVFSGAVVDDTKQMAFIALGFWFVYGLFLGAQGRQALPEVHRNGRHAGA